MVVWLCVNTRTSVVSLLVARDLMRQSLMKSTSAARSSSAISSSAMVRGTPVMTTEKEGFLGSRGCLSERLGSCWMTMFSFSV